MRSVADILGPWVDPGFDSGLIQRCRDAWDKPLDGLTNLELATFLRQNIAVEHVLPVAKERVASNIDDDTELFDGELAEKIAQIEADIEPDVAHERRAVTRRPCT